MCGGVINPHLESQLFIRIINIRELAASLPQMADDGAGCWSPEQQGRRTGGTTSDSITRVKGFSSTISAEAYGLLC